MAIDIRNPGRASICRWVFAVMASLLVMAAVCQDVAAAKAMQAKQKMFKSPEEAVKALADAIEADDLKELLMILGPGAPPMGANARAWPGMATAFLTLCTLRSVFVNVPSFSIALVEGRNTSANSPVSLMNRSCTTRNSRLRKHWAA